MLKRSTYNQARHNELTRIRVKEEQLQLQQEELQRYRTWLEQNLLAHEDNELVFARDSEDTDDEEHYNEDRIAEEAKRLDAEALEQEELEQEQKESANHASQRHLKKMRKKRRNASFTMYNRV